MGTCNGDDWALHFLLNNKTYTRKIVSVGDVLWYFGEKAIAKKHTKTFKAGTSFYRLT